MTNNLKTLRPEAHYFGCFTDAFRKKVHILIYWGYTAARLRIKSDSIEETAITGYIAEAIINRLRAFDCPRWCEDFSIMENRPMQSEGREGKKRPQPDLVIEGNMRGRPEYIFEAKRLKNVGFGVDKYSGEDGLGCFINGKYAARYDEAAMLGYIQGDSPTYWQTKIQEKIKNNTDLNLISFQPVAAIINDLPNEWRSSHRRKGIKRSISIFHIILDFRTGPF
ncbi:MAG: hypothetical protein L0Y73_09150 [Candidatus Aminicenantes bacterium]|nr:hypothetical protein [Candidatus Aminicenantes bacterium]